MNQNGSLEARIKYLFKDPRVILHGFVGFITVRFVQVFIDEPNGKFKLLCDILPTETVTLYLKRAPSKFCFMLF